MCGNSSRQACGGAIAVLKSPKRAFGSVPGVEGDDMSGRLFFQTDMQGGPATHATFARDEGSTDGTSYTVGIHQTGDLTTSAFVSPFLHKFRIGGMPIPCDLDEAPDIRTRLVYPMKVEVGNEGIIGRRVTIWKEGVSYPLAEGIIGYN